MDHKLTVYAETGKPDSLASKVNLAFTITPRKPEGKKYGFDPVAIDSTTFYGRDDQKYTLEWGTKDFAFSTYHTRDMGKGREDCAPGSVSKHISPGRSCTMNEGNPKVVWSALSPSITTPNRSVMVVNNTKSAQRVAALIRAQMPRALGFVPSAAYRPLEDGERIIVSRELFLQVYAVSNQVEYRDILRPKDFEHPLFAIPISCDMLPASSKWKLCQDASGAIQLINDSQPELGHHSIKTLAISHNEMKAQLVEVLKGLSDTQDRLTLMERSIAGIQTDVTSGQQTMAELRASQHNTQVEAKLDGLAESLNQSQNRISTVQNAVLDTQRTLSALEEVVHTTQDRFPDLENKVNSSIPTLEEISGRVRGDLSTVQQLVVATQLSLMTQSTPNPPAASKLADSTEPPASGNRTLSAEAKVEELSVSLGEAKRDVLAIRQYLRTMDRRVPIVEERAGKLENQLGQTRDELCGLRQSLTSTGDRVNQLESRMTAIEGGGGGSTPLDDSQIIFPAGSLRHDTAASLGFDSSDTPDLLDQDYSARLFRDSD